MKTLLALILLASPAYASTCFEARQGTKAEIAACKKACKSPTSAPGHDDPGNIDRLKCERDCERWDYDPPPVEHVADADPCATVCRIPREYSDYTQPSQAKGAFCQGKFRACDECRAKRPKVAENDPRCYPGDSNPPRGCPQPPKPAPRDPCAPGHTAGRNADGSPICNPGPKG